MHSRFLVMAAFLAAALPAAAERSDRAKEIVVGANRLTADDNNKTSTFEGDVVISQGTMRMTAARVTVREDKDRHKYYVANGTPVTFRQQLLRTQRVDRRLQRPLRLRRGAGLVVDDAQPVAVEEIHAISHAFDRDGGSAVRSQRIVPVRLSIAYLRSFSQSSGSKRNVTPMVLLLPFVTAGASAVLRDAAGFAAYWPSLLVFAFAIVQFLLQIAP